MSAPELETSDWGVDCSDEEKYRIEPSDMREVYERISENLSSKTALTLEWKPPARKRAPLAPAHSQTSDVAEEAKADQDDADLADASTTAVPGFDFDDVSSELKSVRPPRRSAGTVPKPKKRVARMEKIMNDMMRHKKLDDEAKASSSQGSSKSPVLRVPQQRRANQKS